MTASTHHFATLFGQEFRITKVGECRRSSVSCNTALRFSVVSGDFPLSGIALPVSTRKVTRLAVRELVLHKGKSFFAKIKIGILLYFVPILKAIFRRQFFVLVDQDKKNICSFLAAGLGISITALDFSIYAGSRKFILPLFHADHGTLLGYAKVYFPGRESFEYGENEVAILKKYFVLLFLLLLRRTYKPAHFPGISNRRAAWVQFNPQIRLPHIRLFPTSYILPSST